MPPPDLPRGADTRLDIIVAAHDLFLRKGFHGTSMRRIAAAANIALGGIYNHFGSKEEIFEEVLLAYHPYNDILKAITTTRFSSFEDLVRNTAEMLNTSFRSQPDLIHLMFIEMVEFRSRHVPALLERILPQATEVFSRFQQVDPRLERASIPFILRTFIGSVLGFFITMNALGDEGPEEFKQVSLDQFIDVYLHGILNTEALS